MSPLVKVFRFAVYMALGLMLLGAVTAAGVYYYLAPQLPDIEQLKDVRFQVPLRVYTREGRLIGEFGEMKRTPITIADVPAGMINAVTAVEDDRFFHHPGVDYQGLMRAAWKLLLTGKKTQGGSTITMQVARNFFLTREKTYLRKLTEILLAFKIERQLSKTEILELYLNKIFYGHRAYGAGAAAQVYYGKPLKELSLAEMAMLAGIPQAPSLYNPVTDPAAALKRRNHVLRRMLEVGHIDQEAYEQARARPIVARLHSLPIEVDAAFVAEQVRADIVARYGENAAYTAGYRVYTTLDGDRQTAANKALHKALLAYDRRHGYRGPEGHAKLSRESGPEQWDKILASRRVVGGLQPAVVIAVEQKQAVAYLPSGESVIIPWKGLKWARPRIDKKRMGRAPKTAADVLAVGDVIRVEQGKPPMLAQIPEVEGALVSLRADDGAVLALVGGFDFDRNKFNRATQARRQPGSSFKPFIYSSALEHGMTPATLINDAPVVFNDASLEQAWRPENYSGRIFGPTRLREALVNSRNLVSIRVLRAVGIDNTLDHVARFGFNKAELPRNLSLALGSGAVAPITLARAYAVFANGGFAVEPYYIQRVEDENGQTLEQAHPATVCKECEALHVSDTGRRGLPLAPRVISPQNAYLMTTMMRDVIRRGTGRHARSLGRTDIAGKTGTTNDQRDAWFAGFNPRVVAVAWVGFDDTRPLGGRETGGRAALPMWIDYMRVALRNLRQRPLEQPPGLVTVRIDPATGLVTDAADPKAMFETFRAGHVPPRRSPRARAVELEPDSQSGGGTGSPAPEQLF
ncbi:MAG TPA: penicillin-binding protein 1A [Gammaproteobacteria bacterium]|nr:penicillin-binding protein 1A [Gammaproteobacteria bacterium]